MISAILSALLMLAGSNREFASYPAEARLTSAPVQPNTSRGKAHRFRSILKAAAALGPNFNGHYRVVHWGCGTNCIEWAVVNLQTGSVWFAGEPAMSCSVLDEPSDPAAAKDWFEFRPTSKLLYLHVCESPDSGLVWDRRRVYVWAGSAMKAVRSDSLAPGATQSLEPSRIQNSPRFSSENGKP